MPGRLSAKDLLLFFTGLNPGAIVTSALKEALVKLANDLFEASRVDLDVDACKLLNTRVPA